MDLRYSDDGGNNWSKWRTIDTGQEGSFQQPLTTRRLGRTRHRIWEIRDTGERAIDILAASINLEVE